MKCLNCGGSIRREPITGEELGHHPLCQLHKDGDDSWGQTNAIRLDHLDNDSQYAKPIIEEADPKFMSNPKADVKEIPAEFEYRNFVALQILPGLIMQMDTRVYDAVGQSFIVADKWIQMSKEPTPE